MFKDSKYNNFALLSLDTSPAATVLYPNAMAVSDRQTIPYSFSLQTKFDWKFKYKAWCPTST